MTAKERRQQQEQVKLERRKLRGEIRVAISSIGPVRWERTLEQRVIDHETQVLKALRAIENHLYSLDTSRPLGMACGKEGA